MEEKFFATEKKILLDGYQWVAGVDEAGRGPLAGPVVAAAVVFRDFSGEENFYKEKYFKLIRDSKKLSEKQRESVFGLIGKYFFVGIGLCDHISIDRLNILEASFLAMKKAISDLSRAIKAENAAEKNFLRLEKTMILVDGDKKITNFSSNQMPIIGGDKIIKSISAASIVAKVTRDRIMLEVHEKYPRYGFNKHKGYGTKIHIENLEKYGPSEIHRRTFAPVACFKHRHLSVS